MNAGPQDQSLDDIRREIDAIDTGLLDLLGQRFRASAKVRSVKAVEGSLAVSPIRPAREAMILRHLVARRPPEVPVDTLVRLWRVILTSSTLAQAAVTVHLPSAVNENPQLRAVVNAHFCATPVAVHPDAAAVIARLEARRGDIGVVTPRSSWAAPLMSDRGDGPHVIGTLPLLSTGGEPQLLVLGYADAQETGDDQTLLVGSSSWSGAAPVWQAVAGPSRLVSLPGFLDAADIARDLAPLGWRLAGRYPTPIKVQS
jgi:chorismate mutase